MEYLRNRQRHTAGTYGVSTKTGEHCNLRRSSVAVHGRRVPLTEMVCNLLKAVAFCIAFQRHCK